VIPQLDWTRFKAVLFDVDGTLYDQPQLRRIMAIELATYCLFFPHRWREAKILATFRRLRELYFEREEPSLLGAQYRWTAEALHIEPAEVRRIADEWLMRRPLRHLLRCRPHGLSELFIRLRSKRIKIGVFSDYPAAEKLRALGLEPDALACATDPHINRLKPHPAGLKHLCAQLAAAPCETLHIGDREDRDTPCAQNCGCASLLLPAHTAKRFGPTKSYDLIIP
jgi:HAD superfamily hydrolase (TIGR01549 family)